VARQIFDPARKLHAKESLSVSNILIDRTQGNLAIQEGYSSNLLLAYLLTFKELRMKITEI
jgi:hypothetical protein